MVIWRSVAVILVAAVAGALALQAFVALTQNSAISAGMTGIDFSGNSRYQDAFTSAL